MKIKILIILTTSFIFCMQRTELGRNDSYYHTFTSNSNGEFLLEINASSNTNWSEENNESSILTIFIDGIYNQDIVLYNGSESHFYKQAIGYIQEGMHTLEVFFDYEKSSINASTVTLNDIIIIDTNQLDIDNKIFEYSPIIYGRNIFEWNESNRTDIPLILYCEKRSDFDIDIGELVEVYTYSVIFSNEDSRVGIGLSDMMLSWGRTTDIEWVYEVKVFDHTIISEIFQGASHTPTEFDGEKYYNHPILINATPNCNFDDNGTSDYKFFLSTIILDEEYNNHTREYLMDQNPWTYKIMGEELYNENKYEEIQDPFHWDMSDVRNYLYVEYIGYSSGSNIECNIQTTFYNDCNLYSNNHNDDEIISTIDNGIQRTAIELPENFNPDNLEYLHFNSVGDPGYNISILNITSLFYLSENFEIIYLNFEDFIDGPIELNEMNPNQEINLNDEFENYDCSGILNGEAYCDDCNICAGGNTDNIPNDNLDDCGVCFGENLDMDCNGECFGDAYIDACGVCDDIGDNDSETCNGCTDINAENYDPEAQFFDNSCIYSDRVFHVPEEYSEISYAIFYASSQDTVLVESGIYNEELDFEGKGIVLISTDGPESTIISANSNDEEQPNESVITIKDTNFDHVTIDGFTLTNGYGKGVDFEYFISVAADPDMFNDMMYNHIKSGGLSIINSSITLSNLIIHNNHSMNVAGGIGLVNSNATLNNILIENNHVEDVNGLGGGGIAINGGITEINNCIIRDNTVGLNMYQLNGGGGILCGFDYNDYTMQLKINHSKIYNNISNIGAGIGVLSGDITLNHNLIYQNIGDYGSAISLGEPLGLVIDDINMLIINSTITNNHGTLSLGMIDNSTLTIANSILWNNGEFEITSLPNNSLTNANIFYSDIRLLNDLENQYSFSSDPLFLDTIENNYQLSINSPCIDTGIDYLEFDGDLILDIDSSDYNGIMPDIGCFEFEEGILYGDINLDSIINILDIVILINFIFGFELDDNYSEQATDINQDNIVNILDVVLLINIVLSY